jgi:hypothetical protein
MPSKLQLVDCFSEDGSSDLPSKLERETGLEPATLALARRCSTTELLPHGHQCSIATARVPGQRNARSIEGVLAGLRFLGSVSQEETCATAVVCSPTRWPSRICRMRSPTAAASGLCVIIKMV